MSSIEHPAAVVPAVGPPPSMVDYTGVPMVTRFVELASVLDVPGTREEGVVYLVPSGWGELVPLE